MVTSKYSKERKENRLGYSPRLDVGVMAKLSFFLDMLKFLKTNFSYGKMSKEFKSVVKNTFFWPFHPPMGDLENSYIFRKFKFQNKAEKVFFLPKPAPILKEK